MLSDPYKKSGSGRYFCFNPFQGIQVLSVYDHFDRVNDVPGFNPFQGIQVLSGDIGKSYLPGFEVSIPFREFKCCRPGNR